MDTVVQHITNKPALLAIFIVALIVIAVSIPYFARQKKLYGSMLEFASTARKTSAIIACLALVGVSVYVSTPYSAPSSNELALVLGNTQNTPAPSISGDVSETIIQTMLKHKGEEIDDLTQSIKVISAVKQPKVVDLDASTLKLREIGNNSSNAKRDAKLNIQEIEAKLNTLAPTNNGSNYIEAIMEARDNVETGSKIIVIGSGLSDSGDLNFSKSGILTGEEARTKAIEVIKNKYDADHLDGYTVEFYGLGDTSIPQEPLSSIQKAIVRDIYKDAIRALGGTVTMNTNTQTGAPVTTNFVVGTTDTGCGEIKLVFDDDDLKFVGDKATFVDQAAAVKALSSIREIWGKQQDTIEAIQIDGYTAHYPGADALSQERADAVKTALVGLGVSSDKVTATGRGFGPYETDTQNRTVKVNISRSSQQCNN
jgi:outer membrane protein OmpA-like peptidoglycan-associated protein